MRRAALGLAETPALLEKEDGTPADPPVLHTAVPTWRVGDTIPLGRDNALRVIETRFAENDEPVLVVKPA